MLFVDMKIRITDDGNQSDILNSFNNIFTPEAHGLEGVKYIVNVYDVSSNNFYIYHDM